MADEENNPGGIGAGRVILYLGLGVLTVSGLGLLAWYLIARKIVQVIPEGEGEPEPDSTIPRTAVLRIIPQKTMPAAEVPPRTIKVETL